MGVESLELNMFSKNVNGMDGSIKGQAQEFFSSMEPHL